MICPKPLLPVSLESCLICLDSYCEKTYSLQIVLLRFILISCAYLFISLSVAPSYCSMSLLFMLAPYRRAVMRILCGKLTSDYLFVIHIHVMWSLMWRLIDMTHPLVLSIPSWLTAPMSSSVIIRALPRGHSLLIDLSFNWLTLAVHTALHVRVRLCIHLANPSKFSPLYYSP